MGRDIEFFQHSAYRSSGALHLPTHVVPFGQRHHTSTAIVLATTEGL